MCLVWIHPEDQDLSLGAQAEINISVFDVANGADHRAWIPSLNNWASYLPFGAKGDREKNSRSENGL